MQVDGEGPSARSGAGAPCAGEQMPGDGVELQGVAPGEGPQEGAHRGGGPHLAAEHGLGRTRPQHVRMVDRVSPPASAEKMRVIPFTPTLPAPGAFPRSTCSSKRARSLNFSVRVAGKRRPASVTAWRPEKATDRRQRLWEDCISRVPFCLGFCGVSQLTFSQERGHLSSICHPIFARLVAGSGLKQNV